MLTELWVSSPHKGTGYVGIDDNTIIRKTAPIWRRFIGQPLHNLVNWLAKDVEVSYLKKQEGVTV